MDDDGLPIVGSGIDLTKVPAIQQRKIVAFLNQFIVHTVRFLNRFSTVCEEVFTCQHITPLCNPTYTFIENVSDLMDFYFLQKLATVSLRIQQIETTLSILEAKLASIPGLEEVTVDGVRQTSAETNGPAVDGSRATVPPVEASQKTQVAPQEPKAEVPAENIMTVAKDPRYARYLKMVQVGVPVMAIKNKMVMEGLDPSLLDTPDAPVPDGAKKGLEDQDDDSSGSESSFSD